MSRFSSKFKRHKFPLPYSAFTCVVFAMRVFYVLVAICNISSVVDASIFRQTGSYKYFCKLKNTDFFCRIDFGVRLQSIYPISTNATPLLVVMSYYYQPTREAAGIATPSINFHHEWRRVSSKSQEWWKLIQGGATLDDSRVKGGSNTITTVAKPKFHVAMVFATLCFY